MILALILQVHHYLQLQHHIFLTEVISWRILAGFLAKIFQKDFPNLHKLTYLTE